MRFTSYNFQGSFFGGEDKLPGLLARQTIFGVLVDPCAAILVFIVTGLLCTGIKEVEYFFLILIISFLVKLEVYIYFITIIGRVPFSKALLQLQILVLCFSFV